MARTFEITEDAYQKLIDVSRDRGETPQQLFQEWLEDIQQLPRSRDQRSNPWAIMDGACDPDKDPLAPFIGTFETDTPDLLIRHDQYLAEAYADDHESD